MISEKKFSEQFLGFWNQCLPFLTPQVVAELNIGGTAMLDSRGVVVKPLVRTEESTNNDLVADTAFGIFAAAHQQDKSVDSITSNSALLKKISQSAFERIRNLRGRETKKKLKPLSRLVDAIEIAVRLYDFFVNKGSGKLIVQPRFKGCGILDSCYGDLYMEKNLYEVKCVERNLRSIDIRQVFTYCALNYQSQQIVIDEVCIVNPRRGITFRFNVETLAQQVSGKNSAQLFHQIGDFLMNFETIQKPS